MYNHAPADYVCPFCLITQGQDSANTRQQDVVYSDNFVAAFVPSHFWENIKGYVIVIPNEHFGDDLYLTARRPASLEERLLYAEKLRD